MMRVLLLRAAIILPLWMGLLYLLTPWINTFTGRAQRGIGVFCVPGLVIGAVLAHKLVEAAGFAHWIITAGGIAWAAMTIGAGLVMSHAIQPINEPLFVMAVTTVTAAIWIGRVTMRDS
ncbi:MAG: hypothetical protein WD768_16535 [Phycisphaeraceae bacterium]